MTTILTGGVQQTVPPTGWHLDGYYFDAWLKLHHSNSIMTTQHPVEYGAAITDHAYVMPRRWSFEIGMTDTVSPTGANQFPANPTRSINAHNIIVDLQRKRNPLLLGTKYGQFSSILIESIDTPDDFRTRESLRATINLIEIIVATTALAHVSLNPNATDITNRGVVSAPQIGTGAAIRQDLKNLGVVGKYITNIAGFFGL